MTANLRLVIIGLLAIVLLIIVTLAAIAIAQVLHGDAIDLPTALIGLIGTPIGALVGVLVPTQLGQAADSTASLSRASSRGK